MVSLKNLSLQQIFDFAVTYLRFQSERCTNGMSCRYRNEDGNRCVVGAMIPDSEYKKGMEGETVYGLVNKNYIDVERDSRMADFLRELQRAHDTSSQEDREERLSHIKRWLSMTAVDFDLNDDLLNLLFADY